MEQRDVVQRLRKLVELYDAVKKSKHRRTPKQLNYEKNFLLVLSQVFDIAPKVNYHHQNKHQNLNLITADVHNSVGMEVDDIDYHHQTKHQDLVQIPSPNLTTVDINDSAGMELDDTD